MELATEVVITTGNLMKCVVLHTIEDEILEADEQFIVMATTNDPAVMIPNPSVTINIMDNDGRNA